MSTRFYLAYGSNLHPLRLTARVPSAQLIDTVELAGYKILFHKRGQDASGKCNLVKSERPEDRAYGAVYAISAMEKADLDQIEGVGNGYLVSDIDLPLQGLVRSCFTYQAEPAHVQDGITPYHWYKTLVHLGAVYHGFPDDYLETLATVPSLDDPDPARARSHDALIAQIKESMRGRPQSPSRASGFESRNS